MWTEPEIAEDVAAADGRAWSSLLRTVEELPGNPYGISVFRCGSATILHCLGLPSTAFNRVMYLEESRIGELPHLLGYFRERYSPVRVDAVPQVGGPSLNRDLYTRGFRPVAYRHNLFLEPSCGARIRSRDLSIRSAIPQDFEALRTIYGHTYRLRGVQPGVAAFTVASVATRLKNPFWRFFIAELDGVTAGAAALHLTAGVATLSDQATLPAMRGRGIEGALVHEMAGSAAEVGADLITIGVGRGSQRQVELLRLGFRLAYTKSIWEHAWSLPWRENQLPERKASPNDGPAGVSLSSSS